MTRPYVDSVHVHGACPMQPMHGVIDQRFDREGAA